MLALRILPVTVTVFNDREELDCCEHGVSPDGKRSDFDTIYLRGSISPPLERMLKDI